MKYVLGLSLVSAVLSTIILPAVSTKADGPAFNFLNGDRELLTGRNETKGETVWKDPVAGNTGDVFDGLVYYHNGVLDTTAINTRIKIVIPVSTTNKTAVLTASISADNAATATDTVVNGNVVGQSGLTVNLVSDADLSFVPGSVRWFPNVGQDGEPVNSVALPAGVNGDDLVSAAGLNIGDIQGCWPFSGYVAFKFKTVAKVVQPSLTLQKTVRNASNNEPQSAENTSAKLNDIVEFNLAVGNNGTIPVDNIFVKDALPVELSFVPGSLAHVAGTVVTPKSDTEANQLFSTGLAMGHPLNPGETHNFRFIAKVSTGVTVEKTVTNTAFVMADAINLSDTATVTLRSVLALRIEKHKGAANTTSGKQATAATIDGRAVLVLNANPGDEIVYSLTTMSVGGVTSKYVVSDDISDILQGADVTKISDSGQINNLIISWPAIDLAENQPLNFTFTVRVKNPLPANPPFDDKLVNVYGDEVHANILRPVPLAPKLKIEKLVRNFTSSETSFADQNEAFAGDILEYRLNFANEGNGATDQIKFSDVLPPNTQYLSGTTLISRNNSSEKTLLDGITGAGINLDQIAAGESGYIKFRVKSSDKIAVGEVLVNTAFLSRGSETISDTARTKIKAAPTQVIPPVEAPKLPQTGPAAGASFAIIFVLGVMFCYAKHRNLLKEQFEVFNLATDVACL